MVKLAVRTHNHTEFIDITSTIRKWVRDQKEKSGILTIFVPHTTAGVTINEHADPDVVRDMRMELDKIIPLEDGYHHAEGNAAAHIKATLTGSSVQVIIENGDLVLGTWQGIFFAEYDGPRTRQVYLQMMAG